MLGVSLSEVLDGVDALGVCVVGTDLAGTIVYWNDSSADLFGWSAEQVLGTSAADLIRFGISQADAASVLLTRDGLPWSGAADVVTARGDSIHVQLSTTMAGARGGLVVSLARPAVESTEAGRPLPAFYDRLTGLPNRESLAEQLVRSAEQHDRHGAPIAVLLVDVDRFKLVNDNRGHSVGDRLLVAVADRLSATCRPSDTVARFGDDEFVVLCPDTNADQARHLSEVICRAFEQACVVDGAQIAISISIGVASTDEDLAADLLQAAERALHYAKARGRGRVEVHDRKMRRSTEGRLQILTDLRAAIDADDLALHYQPIVAGDGRVASVEALLRWNHPRHGAVSPADIIALAENNGLMSRLGRWILNRACSDIARSAEAAAAGLTVAVNLSARQMSDPNIITTVQRALRHSRLPAERLVLEVTETSVVANPETASKHLHALKGLGVRLALDDFGTGYSSLDYVRRFPVDTIKIDRSFIAGMTSSTEDFAIVASLTNLAATVGLEVIAEGVETDIQAESLRRLGCTYTQGFLWSPAVAITDLGALLVPGALHRTIRAHRRQPPGVSTQSSLLDYENNSRIFGLHRAGASPNTIAAALNADGRRTPQGTRWHANTVARVLTGNACLTFVPTEDEPQDHYEDTRGAS
jgi:diguanylate cyclase (GGDEF)-like protein/PAS domain S-box-containing protein